VKQTPGARNCKATFSLTIAHGQHHVEIVGENWSERFDVCPDMSMPTTAIARIG
jgi:hypothetical protein